MPDGAIRYATARDGTRIAYAVSGSGPPLLHLPNGGLSTFIFEELLPERRRWTMALERWFTVVRYDFRGHGHSQRSVEIVDVDAYLDDMTAVVEAAGLGPVTVLGYLGSGPLAPMFAARQPGLVNRIIVWPADYPPFEPRSGAFARFVLDDWPNFTETFGHVAVGWDHPATAHALAEAMRRSISPGAFLQLALAAEDMPYLEAARATSVPALILHRELARMKDPVSQLAAAFPDGRVVVVPGANMAPYIGDMHSVVEAVRAFAGDVGQGAPIARPGSVAAEFTAREMDILDLLSRGMTNQEMAASLVVSSRTVEQHLANIYGKLGVSGKSARAAAAAYAARALQSSG